MNFNKSNRTEWKKLNLQRYQGYHSRKGWFSWKTDGESAHFLNEIPRNDFIRKVIADYPGIWLNGGSGGAELDLFLTKLGISVISMDISANCLGEGRKNFKAKAVNAIQYVVSDLENLPLRDESLDGALYSAVLHHLPNVEASVFETNRVLRPSSPIVLFEPNTLSVVGKCIRLLWSLGQPIYAEDQLDPRYIWYLLSARGFNLLRIQYRYLVGSMYPLIVARLPFKRLLRKLLPFIQKNDRKFGGHMRIGWEIWMVAKKAPAHSHTIS